MNMPVTLYRRNDRSAALLAALTALLATTLFSADASAVAGFARQTGMSCNMCHTSHGGATPNFTFSGKKFNALGYRLPEVEPESVRKGEPEERGEYMRLLPVQWSARFQWQAISNVKPPAGPQAGEWGENMTNSTSRLAIFPFVGPIGEHFGVWTEFYILPNNSARNEWTISQASYEEHDFRYIFNPDSRETVYGLSLNNQGIGEIFGFGPWPAVGLQSHMTRGGSNGWQHPNRTVVAPYGWMNDRWVWALGAYSGDTNMGWDDGNLMGMAGYAWENSNASELWTNVYFRSGDDALPLVTGTTVPEDEHDFFFEPAVGGISATRPDVCPSSPRFIARGCPYLAEDVDDSTTVEAEVRWSQNNLATPLDFEIVGRVGFNREDYLDGADTNKDVWGVAAQFGWEHTYYVKPYVNGYIDYEFTDRFGVAHDIDTDLTLGIWLGYKPVENFLLTFEYHTLQANSLDMPVGDDGARYSLTADISF